MKDCLRGFTLIEAMIAIVVLAMGMTMIMPAIPMGLERLRDQRMKEQAVWLATQEIESLRNLAFRDTPYNPNGVLLANATYQNVDPPQAVVGFPPFQKGITCTNVSTDIKQVTVTIFWPNTKDGTFDRQISLTTQVWRYGRHPYQ